MKVQIKDKFSGKVKTILKRDADILVKLNRAKYIEQAAASRSTYQTKVMTAAPPAPPQPPPSSPTEADAKQEQPPAIKTESDTSQAVKKPLETASELPDTKPKKKLGRPSKNDLNKKNSKSKGSTAKE